MDRPKLVLRFRNFVVDNISGIHAHREVIQKHSSCWWGWWKREDEKDQRELLESLKPPFDVVLISPSEELQYRAKVGAILYHRDPPDLEHIPAYYRERVREIPAWFQLTEIADTPLSSALKASIGTSTATIFEAFFKDAELVVRAPNADRPFVQFRMRSPHIIQLSDIHLADDHHFLFPGQTPTTSPDSTIPSRRLTLVQAIQRDLQRLGVNQIGAVIVSGDIVSKSKWTTETVNSFFRELLGTLELSPDALLIVPGNHDFYRLDGSEDKLQAISYKHEIDFRFFLSTLFNRRADYPLQFTTRLMFDFGLDVLIGMLNSARWTSTPGFHEYGFVGKDVYEAIFGDLKCTTDRPTVKMLVMHHHLLPVEPMIQPGSVPRNPVSITLDAAELLSDAQAAGVSLILHGHQHRPALQKTSRMRQANDTFTGLNEDIYIFGAGSSGSNQLAPFVPNTYSLFSFSPTEVHCRVRELDPVGNRQGTHVEARVPLRFSHS